MRLHLSILTFITAIISSAAAPLKTLTASVGGTITLPASVVGMGFLSYNMKTLGLVYEKKLHLFEENYKERLHWNQNTGYFTLTGLQKNDSGMFSVDSKTGGDVSTDYRLVVYDSVATPEVSVLNRSSESCSLSCSVDSAQDDVTLLWSKDLKILKKNVSVASLSLTVFYQQDLNSPLQCVAENPAENKTVSVDDVRTFCQLIIRVNTNHRVIFIIICIVAGVIVLLSVWVLQRLRHHKNIVPTLRT